MQEVDIAQKALNLGVTANLDAHIAGYLPVHCINQLLVARTFSRNQILIQVRRSFAANYKLCVDFTFRIGLKGK